MIREVKAIIKISDNFFGIPIEELMIDCSKENKQFGIKPLENPTVVPNGLMNPYEDQEIYRRIDAEKQVKVKILLNKEDDYRINWLEAQDILDTFCSWVSFLTLSPVEILEWLEDSTFDGNTLTVGKALFIFPDRNYNRENTESTISVTGISQPKNLQLKDWILWPLPENIIYPLKGFRKAMITRALDEKILNYVTSIEGVSSLMDLEKYQVEKCPHCQREINRATIVSKDGTMRFLEELGFSKTKIYNPINGVRSKFVHADIEKITCSFEELAIVIRAAEALFISFMSYYLLMNTNVPFVKRDELLQNKYDYFHPVFGRIEWLKKNLTALNNSKIKF